MEEHAEVDACVAQLPDCQDPKLGEKRQLPTGAMHILSFVKAFQRVPILFAKAF